VQIEGIRYKIDWKDFTIGSSFFVPCINDVDAQENVLRVMNRLRYSVVIKVVIEDGIRGLRVWRVHRYNNRAISPLLSPLN